MAVLALEVSSWIQINGFFPWLEKKNWKDEERMSRKDESKGKRMVRWSVKIKIEWSPFNGGTSEEWLGTKKLQENRKSLWISQEFLNRNKKPNESWNLDLSFAKAKKKNFSGILRFVWDSHSSRCEFPTQTTLSVKVFHWREWKNGKTKRVYMESLHRASTWRVC